MHGHDLSAGIIAGNGHSRVASRRLEERQPKPFVQRKYDDSAFEKNRGYPGTGKTMLMTKTLKRYVEV